MDIDNEIAILEKKLERLHKEDYDKELFTYTKNYILGTFMADICSPVNLEWKGPYSKETHPQHWLYHILLSIKSKFPKKYATISEKYDIYENKLYNNSSKKKRIRLCIEDLWQINLELYNTLVLSQTHRTQITKKMKLEKDALVKERKQEIIEVNTELNLLKQKVSAN